VAISKNGNFRHERGFFSRLIEERDLTEAALKVQKYLDVNTLITPSDMAVESHSSK